jgi:hypothetical protein
MLRALLLACGPWAALGIVVGGLSIAYAVGRTHLLPAPILTIAVAPFTLVLVGLAWLWSCSLVASRTRIDLVGLMRYDAIAYASLGLYPAVALTRPAAATVGVDLALFAYLAASAAALARFLPGFRGTLLVFAVSRLTVVAIAEATAVLVGYRGTHEPAAKALLGVGARWDGAHYLAIARAGYQGSNLAFFPLYPLSIRLLGFVVGSPILAGLVVSNVAFLVALALLRRLIEEMYDGAVATRTIFYIATFPTAVFFSAVYTESLFLALSIAMFANVRRGRWLAAGFAGGLAALTRIEGVLLIVPYLIEAFAQRDPREGARGRHARRDAVVLGAGMIVLGLLTFMILSALVSGDPLYFLHVQTHWRRHMTWPWTSFIRSAQSIVSSRDAATVAVQATEFAFFASAVALTLGGLRRLPASLGAYTVASLLVPLFTGSLMSGQRFVLVLFPLFVLLAMLGARPAFELTWRTVSLPLLGAFTVLFAAGFWAG